jgi:hypothetical protein
MFKKFTTKLTLSFTIKNPSLNQLSVIRYLVEHINKFYWINFRYSMEESTIRGNRREVEYSLDDREDILEKLNSIKTSSDLEMR